VAAELNPRFCTTFDLRGGKFFDALVLDPNNHAHQISIIQSKCQVAIRWRLSLFCDEMFERLVVIVIALWTIKASLHLVGYVAATNQTVNIAHASLNIRLKIMNTNSSYYQKEFIYEYINIFKTNNIRV